MIDPSARFMLILLAPLLLAMSPPTCAEQGAGGWKPPLPEQRQTGFKDPNDLLAAIGDGRLSTRAELQGELGALKVPDPVRIEFTQGTDIDPSQGPAIGKVVDNLSADFQLQANLIGCSDGSGEAAENRRISRSRAEAVADRLRAGGVASWQIGDVVGRGESCDKQARMVEVQYRLVDVPKSPV